jgi:hypothetical protein
MTGSARNTDPDTSHLAAKKVDVTKLEQQVIDAVRQHGPITAYEVADVLGIPLPSITPRFSPLEAKGRILRWRIQTKEMRNDLWGGSRWTYVIPTLKTIPEAAAMRAAEAALKEAKKAEKEAKLEKAVLHVVGSTDGTNA